MPPFDINERNLIRLQGLFFFSKALAGIFVVLFLYNESDLLTTFIYKIFLFLFLLIWYGLSGWSLKLVNSSVLIKISLILMALHYFLLIVFKDTAVYYVIPLGIIMGTAEGNFWAGFNVAQYFLTKAKKRVNYFSWSMIWQNLGQAVAPILGGGVIFLAANYLIEPRIGYYIIFSSMTVFFIGTVFILRQLPTYQNFHFSISKLFNHPRSFNWRLILGQQFFIGLYDISFTFIAGILMYLILKQELYVGILSTLLFIVGAGGSVLAGKIMGKRPAGFWLGISGVCLGILLFAFNLNFLGLALLSLLVGIFSPFITIWTNTLFFNTLDWEVPNWQDRFIYLLERDIVLGIPRVLSLLFIYAYIKYSNGDQIGLATNWLYILPVFLILVGIFIARMDLKSHES